MGMLEWIEGSITGDGSRSVSGDRELRRQAQAVHRDAVLAGLKVQGLAAVTERAMECMIDLDDLRQKLAGNNEAMNLVLAEFEVNFARCAGQIQRNAFGWHY
jgi:hypothetical protein